MENKEFWVEVSFTGRMKMSVDAKNKEDAIKEVFDKVHADFEGGENITVEEVEWDLIKEVAGGNIGESFLSDLYIEEE